MSEQINNYQCPACTGPLHFDAESGKLKCDYCDNSYTVEEVEKLYAEKQKEAEENFKSAEETADYEPSSDWGDDTEKMRAYSCPSCGAEIICEETTAATSCPYCGNPSVVPGNFAGTLKPDYIIPFKLHQDEAKAALKKHYKNKRFLPNSFKTENKISEIKGIYVPFWMFDGNADVSAHFNATRSTVRRDGNYEVTTTRHYRISRAGNVSFEKIPVDASTKMPDDYMDSVEPFNYNEIVPFSTAYLPGFLADKYDVTSNDCYKRALDRASNSAVTAMRNDVVGYDTCATTDSNVNMHQRKTHYAMLPVYILNTKWRDKDYLFAMNGQTGKMISKLPISVGKFLAWFGGLTASLTLIIGSILFFLT